MSCVLSIVGENLDVDTFVGKTNMPGFRKWHKGDPLAGSAHRTNKYSRVTVTTSEADFDDVKGQIADTIRFLTENRHNLKMIASTPNIDYATIDFGVDSTIDENRLTQGFYFPKDLIKICSELDIEIQLSIYKDDTQLILERNYQKKKLGKL